MLKILVTGVNGFVGKHVVREVIDRGHKAIGLAQSEPADTDIADLLADHFICDLGDSAQVDALPLDDLDGVINLAGLANVGASFDKPDLYKQVNVAVLEIMSARLLSLKSKARVVAISTGAVYDNDQPMPLTETSKTVTAGSPYAQSKLLMEAAGMALRKKGLDIVVARPFNHIGPGQRPGFLVPDLHKKLLAFKESGTPVLVGNLKTKRDYTDVRDIAKAYVDLVVSETLEHDTYNICSGKSHSGSEILDLLSKEMGLEGKVVLKVDSSLVRPNDPVELMGSNHRLQEETGWSPTIPLEQTIADFVATYTNSEH